MILTDVTSTEVRNVVASLKNSNSGYDEFPPFVGKSCVEAYNYRTFNTSNKFILEVWCISIQA